MAFKGLLSDTRVIFSQCSLNNLPQPDFPPREVSRDERITLSYPCFLRIFWQQLCFRWFPPLTKNTHEALRYDYLRITQKRPGHKTGRELKLYLISSFLVRLLMGKLSSSSTRDGGAGTNKFNPTSSFVSEWMLSPDVVFFHGITEVFSYFQDNYFSAKDEYDKARNTVLELVNGSLNKGHFFP